MRLFVQGLEERLRAQTNSNSNKPISTRSTTSTVKTSRYTFKDEKLDSHTDKNGVCYRVGGKSSATNRLIERIQWRILRLFSVHPL